MNQKDFLLQHIGQLEGKVITPELARQCRGLAGEAVSDPHAMVMEAMKSQLLILMLRDLGGRKTYTIAAIDDETSEFNLVLRKRKYHGQDSFEFKLVKK